MSRPSLARWTSSPPTRPGCCALLHRAINGNRSGVIDTALGAGTYGDPVELRRRHQAPRGPTPPIKRLHVPDARFTLPGFTARVQQKSTVTLNFESDEGTLSDLRRLTCTTAGGPHHANRNDSPARHVRAGECLYPG